MQGTKKTKEGCPKLLKTPKGCTGTCVGRAGDERAATSSRLLGLVKKPEGRERKRTIGKRSEGERDTWDPETFPVF